jgi:hypothetical protein
MDNENALLIASHNVTYAVYDSMGYVLRRGVVPTVLDVQKQSLNSGENIITVPGLLDPTVQYYVKDNELIPCEPIKLWVSKTTVLANGVDNVRITDIPEGASVLIVGNSKPVVPSTVVDDRELSFTFTEPTKLKVYIEKRPVYAQTMVEINAV